jgi:ribosomal protein S18 acetylase RimI-like enzyme
MLAAMSTTDTRVWIARPDEAETVATLLSAFRDHLGHSKLSDNAILAGVERLMEGLDAEYLLACADDDSPPTGVAQLRYRFGLWLAGVDCWLEDLYVMESARRRGVGSALVQAAIARASERGARRIELDTTETNTAAIALYEAHGLSARSKGGAGRDLLMGRHLEEDEAETRG